MSCLLPSAHESLLNAFDPYHHADRTSLGSAPRRRKREDRIVLALAIRRAAAFGEKGETKRFMKIVADAATQSVRADA